MSAGVQGLPGPLPEGERLLWQGAPRWRTLALRALHVRKLAIYFLALLAWFVIVTLARGDDPWAVALTTAKFAAVALVPLGLLTAYAWLAARSTVYSITNRRVVLRIGVALPMTLNLPFRQIESADLKLAADGRGDIALVMASGSSLGYVILWPHARPWHFGRAQPSLRCIPDAARVAQTLARALAASAAVPVQVAPQARPADAPRDRHAAAAA